MGSSSYHLKDKGGSDYEYDYGDYYGAAAEAPKVRVPAGTTGIRRFLVLVDSSELLDTWGCDCCDCDSVGETQANRGNMLALSSPPAAPPVTTPSSRG